MNFKRLFEIFIFSKSSLLLSFIMLSVCTIKESKAIQTNKYMYRQISQKEGLSHHKVTAIVKDKHGTCWVGTQYGLNRITEETIIHYDTFLNQNIKFIFKDSLLQIWVATSDELFLYDYETDKFNIVKYQENLYIRSYCVTKDGVLFCNYGGIYMYRYDTKEMQEVLVQADKTNTYNSLYLMNEDKVIVSCNATNEIYSLDLNTNTFELFENISLDPYNKLFIDSKKRLWVSVYNKGLLRYSLENGGRLEKSFTAKNSNLSHNIILDIQESDNKLLISTDGGGVNIIDIQTDHISHLSEIINPQVALQIRSVLKIYVDDNENLWFGSVRNGVINIENTYMQRFDYYNYSNKWWDGINTSTIICICEDYDGNVWIGTDGDGLGVYNPQKSSFKHIKATKNLKITGIENIDNDWFIVSIYNKGVYRINKHNGAMIHIPIVDKVENDKIINRDLTIEFVKYSDDKIFIIANDLYVYDIQSKKITFAKNSGIVSRGGFDIAYHDKEQSIIYNHYKIYSVDNNTSKAILLYHSSDGDIMSVRKKGDVLWLIQDNSLVSLNTKTNRYSKIETPYDNRILIIELDQRDHIWLSTYDNIICMDINDPQKYITFDNADGFGKNQYIPRASLITDSGDLYLGGNNGFLYINNQIPLQIYPELNVSLLSIHLDNKIITQKRTSSGQSTVTIPWDYTSLGFNFCVEKSNIFRKNKFKYTIVNNKKHTVIHSDNSLSLPILSLGEYEIEVSYLNNNGQWSIPNNIINITVTPPWWETTLFSIFIFTTILGILLLAIYKYSQQKKRNLLHLYKEHEQELSANKIMFLINISHELRTPLTLICAPLKRLLDSYDINIETKKEIARIFDQSKYMSKLINMVLDIRKMEVGYGEISIQMHDLHHWVKEVAEEFRAEFDINNIKLIYDFDSNIKSLNFDENKCKVILSNLLMNAYKYSDSNTTIIVKSTLADNRVRLSIIDEGIGLEGIDVDNLFNRFVQAHDKSAGSGIGLSYSKMLVELHPGGKIAASPNKTVGSTFYFELPLNLKCEKTTSESKPYLSTMFDTSASESNNELSYSLLGHSILIAEDQQELLHFIKDSLKIHFKNVYIATNGEKAYEMAKHYCPDIIVSDVMMPKMNGYELCYNIKNNIDISHIPIVLLTAKVDPSSKVLGYKSGADIYLSKPFDMTELLSVIRSQLYSREMTKRRYQQSNIGIVDVTFSNADEQFMLKLNAYIKDNLTNEDLNVQTIIDHMCMGRAAFYKKLKAIIDIGAMEYVVKIKMTIATEKLLKTSDPIADIALSLGYPDSKYFSKVFKLHYNSPPSDYRKKKGELL